MIDPGERIAEDPDPGELARARRVFAGRLHVLVPGQEAGTGDPGRGTEVRLLTLDVTGVDGVVVPAFTDPDRVAAFIEEHGVPTDTTGREVAGGVLADMVGSSDPPAHVLVDPGSDDQWLCSGAVLRAINRPGVQPEDMAAGAPEAGSGEAIIGRPQDPLPGWFAGQVARACRARPAVRSCWEALWFIPDRHPHPMPVLAVELDSVDDADRILPEIWSDIAAGASELAGPIELVCLNHLDGFLDGPVGEGSPVYERDSGNA